MARSKAKKDDIPESESEEQLLEEKPAKKSRSKSSLILKGKVLPKMLHILPVFERPFFPAQAFPILMNEEPWLETVEEIGRADEHYAGLLLVRGDPEEPLLPKNFYAVGSIVELHHPGHSSGKMQFIAEGIQRFTIVRWLSASPPYRAIVEYAPEVNGGGSSQPDEVKAYAMAIINALKDLLPLNPLYSEELKYFLNRFSPNDPSPLTDFAAALTSASKEELQSVLELFPIIERMQKVLVLLKNEIEVAKLQTQIRKKVEEKMTDQQRKFFLREQLKEIQQELGIAKDDRTAEIDRFSERIKLLTLPDEAKNRFDEEMDKLAILETGSPEYSVTRNYLDWVTNLPWGITSKDRLELTHARRVLDKDHDGLDDVKERILEFLAVGKLKGEISGSILLLVGPPGVGKTSIGRSIAAALERKFYRFSLGGMRDEAEIKGHRRTYIGAMPGKIIQAIKDAKTQNPVIMLDEIDKIGASYQGDPASALLEVLDPEQNNSFLDHYLDLRFDLSKTLFICTANQLDTIPGPLLDRMEVIRLSGYIAAEKLLIAKNHLVPRQLERNGVRPSQLKISDVAITQIIDGYAREAGVRNLEKQLGKISRKAARKVVDGFKGCIRIGPRNLSDFLGKPTFAKDKNLSGIGVVTGLAWTSMGGATLSIEASLIHTKNRGFKLTGQMGDVMKESADIAYSFIAANLKQFQGSEDFFDNAFVHLHIPEGATPKDGPSAGITMAVALLSLARRERITKAVAMTGELTLTGHIFPIGGVREKVIAARRSGVFELIFPNANRGDFEELPEHIRENITPHFVKHFRDVLPLLFRHRD
ncbi:MAG: endopeptidase La [Gammaproteobacteria bacterium]|nr:endopeptidase La [Gammaproteobacteria bacterium]